MSTYLRILKKYGVLVEDNEGLVEDLVSLPHRKDQETFKQWKIRVFGRDIEGISVYRPFEPAPQTKMSTLSRECGSEYLLWALKDYRSLGDEEAEEAIEIAVVENTENLTKKLTTFPAKIIGEIIHEYEDVLQPSAVEFLKRRIGKGDARLNTKEMLVELIKAYSELVKFHRSKY